MQNSTNGVSTCIISAVTVNFSAFVEKRVQSYSRILLQQILTLKPI